MEIVIIAAVSDNGVIGKDGKIPWRCAEDMRRFKSLTTSHGQGDDGDCLIMGRRTYESIGKPLPKRNNVIVSASLADMSPLELKAYSAPLYETQLGPHDDFAHVYRARSLRDALSIAHRRGTKTAWICGGSQIYEEALPYATAMELTYVEKTYDGDAFFPYWPRNAYDVPYPWRAVDGVAMAAQTSDGALVHFVRLERAAFAEETRQRAMAWLKEAR